MRRIEGMGRIKGYWYGTVALHFNPGFFNVEACSNKVYTNKLQFNLQVFFSALCAKASFLFMPCKWMFVDLTVALFFLYLINNELSFGFFGKYDTSPLPPQTQHKILKVLKFCVYILNVSSITHRLLWHNGRDVEL